MALPGLACVVRAYPPEVRLRCPAVDHMMSVQALHWQPESPLSPLCMFCKALVAESDAGSHQSSAASTDRPGMHAQQAAKYTELEEQALIVSPFNETIVDVEKAVQETDG